MKALWCLLLVSMVGCASVSGQRVSPDDAAAAVHELRGPSSTALDAEAALRCPGGHEVLRRGARDERLAGQMTWTRLWNQLMAHLDDDDNRAQLAIRCKSP